MKIIITGEQLKAINEAAMNFAGMVNGATATPDEITKKANGLFAQDPGADSVLVKNTNPSANKP